MLPYVFCSLQGFPGDLARSLDEDSTLSDVLQMLDEYYGVIMTCDALSKELHSLKQESGENVAELLQLEYPWRIQPEHVEEMKCDCFYEGLNSQYQ